MRLWGWTLFLVAATSSAVAQPPSPTTKAQQIFDAAFRRWQGYLVHVAPSSGDTITTLPDVAGLKTIATVVAIAQPACTIGNSDENPRIEAIDGHQAYHLQLRPSSDPQKHNLRDLWIDVATHDLWKAHFVGTYAPAPKAPVSATDVTVSFRQVLGCWVVTRAVWTYQGPPTLFKFDVQANEIGLPTMPPEWLFDPQRNIESTSLRASPITSASSWIACVACLSYS